MNSEPPENSPSSAKGHLPFLDAFRGIAILMVLACHSVAESHSYFSFDGWMFDFKKSFSTFLLMPAAMGGLGVAVFFVLSGFCIHLSHARASNKSFALFFVRRFFRLYPAYFVALLYFVFFFHWRTSYFANDVHFVFQLVTHLLLVHNYSATTYFGFNAAFWSLAVEAQLYVLYPLLLLLARRHGWGKAVAVTAFIEIGIRLSTALYEVLHPGASVPRWFTDNPFGYWFCWSMGAGLAEAYLSGQPLPRPKMPYAVYISLLFVCYCFEPLQPFYFLLGSLVTVQLIAHCLEQEGAGRIPSLSGRVGTFLQRIGIFSYSAYLLHTPLLFALSSTMTHAAWKYQVHVSPLWIFAILLFSCVPILLVSYFFYRVIEVPSSNWGKRIVSALKTERGRSGNAGMAA